MSEYTGMYVATLTPFDANDRVDVGALRAHAAFLVESGVAGLCPAGTTGEFLFLSLGEKVRVVEETVAAAAGRVKVIAGVSALRPHEVALLCRGAKEAGADAVFLPPPIYYPADDETIYRHYAAAREAAELPVFAYNIPAYAANAISLACAQRLMDNGIIAGIKDSSASVDRIQSLIDALGRRIAVMAASDSFASRGRQLGAHGFISALANIWPRAFVRLWAGDESLQPAVDAVRTAVKQCGGIPALKALSGMRGHPMGASRLPHVDLPASKLELLRKAFQAAAEAGME